jgi:predicted nucleic acid-binding protein
MIFSDTSAVAKFYLPESGSRAVRELFETEEVALSELARVELTAVFHRCLREKRWGRSDFDAALRQFSRDDAGGFWTWLPLDRAIIIAAAEIYARLPGDVFLRSSDCLHLMSAIHYDFDAICTYDTHQTTAAASLGLKAFQA